MPDLSGVMVVVTRPAHQAENLCRLIEAAGGKALRFPVIEIRPPKNPQHCLQQLARFSEFDLAIFVSANAVDAAIALLKTSQHWPTDLPIAAVGKATAKTLSKNDLSVTLLAPEPHNSEALLSLPGLQNLEGKRILIFRGDSGREFLRDRLIERGAQVEYLECYQRIMPNTDASNLYAAWGKQQTLPVVVTSNQSLHNLLSMVNKEHLPLLIEAPLIVISERTKKLAAKLGFKQTPIVAVAANDEEILVALKTWAKS